MAAAAAAAAEAAAAEQQQEEDEFAELRQWATLAGGLREAESTEGGPAGVRPSG